MSRKVIVIFIVMLFPLTTFSAEKENSKLTRPKLIAALQMLENKRDTNPPKKHGNIPL